MLFFYDQATGGGEAKRFDSSGNYQNLTMYPPGTFRHGWTHVARYEDSMIFFYNARTGQAEVGSFDPSSGAYTPLRRYPEVAFHPGYTHVVTAPGVDSDTLLFYDAATGQVEAGSLDPSSGAYQRLIEFPPGFFHEGWTHIVDFENGTLLFYDAATGQGNLHLDLSASYQSLKYYPPGTFRGGWKHIVRVGSGTLLFFEQSTGQTETGYLDSANNLVVQHSYLLGSFFIFWTHIVSFGSDDLQFDNLLFYAGGTGQVDVGRLDERGTFQSLKYYPSGASRPGWTHLVYSVLPT